MGALADLRTRAAGALDGLAPVDDDWPVHDGPVDSVTPPCFVLVWSDPWLTRASVCSYVAQLQVLAVAVRMDPAPGIEQLEQLTEAAVGALQDAGLAVVQTSAPVPLEIGGIHYQSARLTITHTITIQPGG